MKGTALKKISGNAGALVLIQSANALLPLILAPYLGRVLGTEGYGMFAIGVGLIQVAVVFTDYGFGLSAVYQIARARHQRNRVRRIIAGVYTNKIIICAVVTMALLAYPALVDTHTAYRHYFWLLSLSVIGLTLQPTWLFQGVERMGIIAAYVLLSRLSFIALTVLLVKGPDDLERVALLNGITHLASATLSMLLLHRAGWWPIWPGFRYAGRIFRSSSNYFLSRLAVVSYGAGAILFLGTFSSPTQVALYSVAEQFYRGALAVFAPATQAIYPHMARHRDVALYKKLLKSALALTLLGVVLGLLTGQALIELIFGQQYRHSYPVFLVFMLALGAAIPSTLLGYPLLGAMGNATAANRSVLFAGLVQLISLLLLWSCNLTSALNVVSVVLIAEISALVWRIRHAIPYLGNSSSKRIKQ